MTWVQGGGHEEGLLSRSGREALAGTAVLVPDALHAPGSAAAAAVGRHARQPVGSRQLALAQS